MPSKFFNGVDFDEKGNIKPVRPVEYRPTMYKWPETSAFVPPPPPLGEHKSFVPHSYRSDQLDKMNQDEFEHLQKWVAREAHRRELVAKQKLLHDDAAYTGLSNFLAGCTQALACRAALRWAQGHRPFSHDGKGSGSHTTSGEMWNVFDVARLGDRLLKNSGSEVRHKDKEYIINVNPMLWNMTNRGGSLGIGGPVINDATRWLMMGSNIWSFPRGTKFCGERNVGGVAAQ